MNKKFMPFIIFIGFLNLFCGKYNTEDFQIYSNYMNVTDVEGDLNGIYASTTSGIIFLDKLTDKMQVVVSFKKGMYDIPFSNLMVDAYRQDNFYFRGRENIYHYDKFNDTLYFSTVGNLLGKNITNIGMNRDSLFVKAGAEVYGCDKFNIKKELWALRASDSAIVWDDISKEISKYTFLTPYKRYFNDREYDMTSYFEDMNDIYIGTNGAGIYKVNIHSFAEKHYPFGLGSFSANAVAVDSNGFVWTAGRNTMSITRINPLKNTFEYFYANNIIEIPDNQIIYITCSKTNVLFLTEYGQAFYYSLKDLKFHSVDNEKGSILFRAKPIDNDRFVIANDLGVGMIDIASGEFTQINDKLKSAIDIEYYRDTIYTVSSNTLYSAQVGDSVFKQVEFSFPTFIIYQYYRTDKIEILLDNAYIHIKEKGDTAFASYPCNLFGEFYDMAYDDGNVWVASTNGIGRFMIKNKRWKIYTQSNSPLPSNSFQTVAAYGDFVYFGAKNALTKFYYKNPLLNE